MPDTIDDAQEHPALFNEWEVTRTLAGKKTQMRRIVKPQPEQVTSPARKSWTPDRKWLEWKGVKQTLGALVGQCPYGQPDDVLWVREGFQFPEFEDDVSPRDLVDYWVGEAGAPPPVKYSTGETKRAWNGHDWGRKRPSIHMPRELCRLRLRVEDVRVERAQEISPADAHAEGIPRKPRMNGNGEVVGEMNPVGGFKKKWRDIHGDGAWERNDWVWVIEFARYDE